MNTLIDKIRLKNHEIETVSKAKDHLISNLKSKAADGLLPTAKDFFLTGSYRRGTKITPLDDVDIFYVIGHAQNRDNTWHSITDCDFTFGSDFWDVDRNLSSIKVLELIKKEVKDTYPQSDIRRDGEVVNLFLDSHGVGFDIVPVFEIKNSNYYLMPNGKGSTKWNKSNPLLDEAIINGLDDQHNNLLKDTIRIVKYWFRKKQIKSPRLYHLEATAYHVFSGLRQPITSYEVGLITLLGSLNFNSYLKSCPDPTQLSEPISSGLTDYDIVNIIAEASEAISHLANGSEKFIEYVEG